MGTYFTEGLKDLTGEAHVPRRKTRRRDKKQTPPQESPDAVPPPAESPRRPKGLEFDPLKQNTPRREANATPTDPTVTTESPKAGGPSVTPETQDLVDNITALFAELGTANEAAEEEMVETSDVTESLLRAFNENPTDPNDPDFGLGEGMDSELLGKALAENVMKQVTAKSIIYEPLKDISERYAVWLKSDAVVGLMDEEVERHRKLLESMQELIHVYETDPENISRIMDLFAKSQSFGSPPEEVYGSIADPVETSDEGPPNGAQECFQQ